jgi:hypothetical protein
MQCGITSLLLAFVRLPLDGQIASLRWGTDEGYMYSSVVRFFTP